MASEEYPTTVSGGCLCGSVRYTVTFPASHDWKRSCSTCQCSQCRKNGGSLIAYLHQLPASSVAFTSQTTLSRYHATEGCARGFCTACGSWLFWRSEDADTISMSVGTLDKEVLKRWGKLLAHAEVHLWCEDEIEGATDHLRGEKWKQDNEGAGAERID
ncbi:CENP-V/GFA domain-containing protein [Fusarium keratoplasticum]|uniref:CENP-V/GFA domain-containing protein n=1 Tax=Fusarium keratoplasticum TaxID=1328300 RepID=A0ACC0R4T8_9HYPO|nr:CENP-V/GFA domain-containing protein [Fusarium keratoplasticum]KAI8675248.1 CENP-V/GFA domain-containing protein [Fusarium keratoplasticum]